jgi:broad specificity phosphatase PhoE
MYVAAKTSNGRTYYQLVKSVRVNGKPTHRVVCYLGKHKSAEAALEVAYQDLEALYTSPLHDKLTTAEATVRHVEDRIKMRYAKALNKWHGGEIPSREVVAFLAHEFTLHRGEYEYLEDWVVDVGDKFLDIEDLLQKDLPLLEAKRKQARALTEAFEEKQAKIVRRIERLQDVVTKLG